MSADIPEYSCDDETIGHCATVPANTTILLRRSLTNDELLTLTRVTDGKHIAPVGRSYSTFNWQRVAGPYDTLSYDCSGIKQGFCQVTVPEAASTNQTFSLSRFENKLSLKLRIARFLEQVTFGTKPEELQSLFEMAKGDPYNKSLYSFFGDWAYKQMYQTSSTLHRELFRSHVSPRYIDRRPTSEGIMSNPCKSGGRWRRSSFSLVDIRKDITITKTASNRYALSMDGHVRTILDEIKFQEIDQVDFDETNPIKVKLCALNTADTFSGFGIRYKNKCRRFEPGNGNPPVDIEGLIDPLILEGINPNEHITQIFDEDSGLIESMLLSKDLSNDYQDLCNSIDLKQEIPVFAKLTTGQHLIFDPMLELEDNSLASPLNDGGAINSIVSKKKTLCMNTPRTFLNDKYCQLTSTSACTLGNTLDNMTLTLNEENLKELYDKTGRYYYVVKGLRFDDFAKYTENILNDYPCNEKAKSRWVKMVDNNCVSNVQKETSSEFTLPY